MPSLQDQLLKAGIANKKNAKRAAAEKRRDNAAHKAANQGKKKHQQIAQVSDAQRAVEQQAAEKLAKDQALNKQKKEAAAAKELSAQVKQLIEMNVITREGGDTAYRFTHNGETQAIYINNQQQKQLANGLIAVAELQGDYHLVPAGVAQRIQARLPEAIALLHEKQLATDEDDPYADYEIPDDFSW